MERAHATVDELCRLFPDLEELEYLCLGIAASAHLDAERKWSKSGVFSTMDGRVVSPDEVQRVVKEAEAKLHQHITTTFAALHPVLRAFWAGDTAGAALALIGVGDAQEQAGRIRKALECFQAAFRLALPLPDKSAQIIALRRMGRMEKVLGNLQEAAAHYHRSAGLARDTNDAKNEVIARTGYGNVLLLQERWPEAEASYRTALECVEAATDPNDLLPERAQLLYNSGTAFTQQGRFDEAEQVLDLAQQILLGLDSPADLAICYHCRGTLRRMQQRPEEGREFFQTALELDAAPSIRAVIALDLAQAYLADGFVSDAIRHARKAEGYALAARSPYSIGETYRGLGVIGRARGEESAIVFFEKALQIARDKEYPLLEGETLLEYAALRTRMGDLEEARAYLLRAAEVFEEIGSEHEKNLAQQALTGLPAPVAAELAAD